MNNKVRTLVKKLTEDFDFETKLLECQPKMIQIN